MKKAALCLMLLFYTSLSATILETAHFSQLPLQVTEETLVILDIDDTLLIPKQTLGSDVWFTYQWEKYKEQGMPVSLALEKSLADWEAVRHITSMELVEPDTNNIVQKLQESNITVMGLTTQGLALATRTVLQLNSVGIDLTQTAPFKEDCYFMNPQSDKHGVLFRHGILFTSGTPKGPALLALLEKIGYRPKSVVFINDKESHLLDVSAALEKEGIPFLGLRYGFGDARVKAFRKEIAEVQFHHSSFAKILSDTEAEALLLTK
jgi:hypothetical protein